MSWSSIPCLRALAKDHRIHDDQLTLMTAVSGSAEPKAEFGVPCRQMKMAAHLFKPVGLVEATSARIGLEHVQLQERTRHPCPVHQGSPDPAALVRGAHEDRTDCVADKNPTTHPSISQTMVSAIGSQCSAISTRSVARNSSPRKDARSAMPRTRRRERRRGRHSDTSGSQHFPAAAPHRRRYRRALPHASLRARYLRGRIGRCQEDQNSPDPSKRSSAMGP